MNDHYRVLPISTDAAAAASAVHQFAEELLSHGAGAAVIFDALLVDPECALAHAYAAALYLTQLTRAGQARAAPHLAAAMRLAPGCSSREAATIAAINAWGSGDDRHAADMLRGVVEDTPHDLVAAKLGQILELGLGDIKGMLRTSGMATAAPDRCGHALGLHAFALEQAGHASVALRFAQVALERSPAHDPWAQHTAAHAMIALGRKTEARALLIEMAPSWDRCSSFMLTHNWWHLALLELEEGNRERALTLFDQRVWGVRKGHVQDQINAIALLARLQLAGVSVAGRWQDIAAQMGDRTHEQMNDFLALHDLIVLANSGRDAAAARLVGEWQGSPVARSIAEAVLAHSRADHAAAVAAIAPFGDQLPNIGGSNIQRELFAMILRDSQLALEPRCVAA